jgi:hypothetical protein
MAAQFHGRQSYRTSTNSIERQVLPEKLTSPQLVKKFPAFYRTRRFITAFTRARHLPLSWARSIQYIPPSLTSKIHFNISLPSTPGSSGGSFPQLSPPKPCMHLALLPHTCYMPCPFHSSWCKHPNDIWHVTLLPTFMWVMPNNTRALTLRLERTASIMWIGLLREEIRRGRALIAVRRHLSVGHGACYRLHENQQQTYMRWQRT